MLQGCGDYKANPFASCSTNSCPDTFCLFVSPFSPFLLAQHSVIRADVFMLGSGSGIAKNLENKKGHIRERS